MMLKNFIICNKIFISLYLTFLFAGALFILLFEKGDEIVYFNSLHNPLLDDFFKWVTRLAEFPALLLIILLVAFTKFGNGLLLTLNTFIVFICTAVFKKLVFADQVRPSIYFEGKLPLNFVEGMDIYHYNSFPSGHTAAGFAVFFLLSIMNKDKRWGLVFFLVALMIGVSRVYLLQHFFRDVYFGSLLAVIVTSLFWLSCTSSRWYKNLSWKDKAIFK